MYKYIIVDSGSKEIVRLSEDGINELALHAPLVERMASKLAQLNNFYPNDEELEELLAEIAELEKPG